MPPKVNKIEVELKKLTKIEGNKTCADCPDKMPSYVDLTHNIFVCTKCAGIHRDFQFKVKGISMSVFTEEDVAFLASMGNELFNSKYLARLNTKDFTLPNGNDIVKLKDFIKQKYMDKKWCEDDGSSSSKASLDRHNSLGPSSGSIVIKPLLSKQTSDVGNRRASTGNFPTTKTSSSSEFGLSADMDLLNMDSPVPSKDPFASNAVPSKSSTAPNSFDPFGGGSGAAAATTGGFDPFGSPSEVNKKTFDPFESNTSGGHKPVTSTFDAFSTTPAPVANNGTGVQMGGFNAFGSPPPQQNAMPMPFIKISGPPPAAQAVASPEPAAPVPKNFSAFDDLLAPSSAAAGGAPSHPHPNSANPFDLMSGPSQQPQIPRGPGPAGPYAQQQQQQQLPPQQMYYNHPAGATGAYGAPQQPYGQQQMQPPPQGYPGGGGAPGYPWQGQGPPPGAPYFNPNPGQPPQGYTGGGGPPHQQQYQQPYPPQQAYPGGGGYAPNAYGGGPPGAGYGVGPPPQHQPQQQQMPPAAPDPFAAMGGLAWAGHQIPSNAGVGQQPASAPKVQQQESVNPFDMF